jgi:hypothetical protein
MSPDIEQEQVQNRSTERKHMPFLSVAFPALSMRRIIFPFCLNQLNANLPTITRMLPKLDLLLLMHFVAGFFVTCGFNVIFC